MAQRPVASLFDERIDSADPDGPGPGCRLKRLEVYNWGTFNESVWAFEVDGRNALLTGDIGSGKSTLVDAITTLLLPANRVAYNKAAGADTRERDLRSYVLGHHKSERNEETGGTRPVGLRGPGHYSVLLAVFANGPDAAAVSIAQVFRAREDGGQPERFYVVAEDDLSIAEQFTVKTGETLKDLRRRLRETGAAISDSFPDYGRTFRRSLGIESEQALDLFHQTVSMKAVDNLNDFVRAHMLEPFPMGDRIQSLILHFNDLTKAHESVVRARHQLELLNPIVGHLDDYDAADLAVGSLDRQLSALPMFFDERTRNLLRVELDRLAADASKVAGELVDVESALAGLREREAQLNGDIARNGGNRLAEIESEITRLDHERSARRSELGRLNELLSNVGLAPVSDRSGFDSALASAEQLRVDLDQQMVSLDDDVLTANRRLTEIENEAAGVNAELHSLSGRRSNLPLDSVRLRDALCADLNFDVDELPFAGELIQVRAEAEQWEGAAERVLRSFAMSILVPDARYSAVARWINERHLGTRLVYFRVPARVGFSAPPTREGTRQMLFDVLEVKPDSPLHEWLEAALLNRANLVCVDTVDEFRSYDRAVTREGQIKAKDRHEKDDRRRIDDRRNFVLGWSNEQKIAALVEDAQRLHSETDAAKAAVAERQKQRHALREQQSDLARLKDRQRWDDHDHETSARLLGERRLEAERIRAASNVLTELSAELERNKAEQRAVDTARSDLLGRQGSIEGAHQASARLLDEVEERLIDGDAVAVARESFVDIERAVSAEHRRQLDDLRRIRVVQDATRDVISQRRGEADERKNKSANRATRAMRDFRTLYAQDAAELDDSIESAAEYRTLRDRVATDDLPRFEAEFRRSLQENTINEIAGLSAALGKQESTITERVARINESLESIDYNQGRYIRLVPEPTPNTEIRQFRDDLRACTSNITRGADDNQYSEARFEQVKAIIDRFRGREGTTDLDRAWTRRVSDVRQWFVFSASERWRETDAEHESYSDSSGKSGGQKEKLAYTILAASLAYQFQLDRPDEVRRSFRFVVIDEAFGRGSDDSTRYALGLFTKLGLQLLIVTPLQKIDVIEPHVSCVGLVQNLSGDRSTLQRITMTEYRAGRADALRARRQVARGRVSVEDGA